MLASTTIMKEHLQKVSPSGTTKMSDMGNIHKEITIDNRIFLKGFQLETNEEDLENIFKTYGSIVETKIIRDTFTGQNKGFGFITFDSQQVAQNILSSVKSVQLEGSEITVGPAKIRRSPPPSKAFRYNHYNGNGYDATYQSSSNQYMSLPYSASSDGFFTFYPQTFYPYQKIPYHQDQTPVLQEQNNELPNNGNRPVDQNIESGKIMVKSDNHIMNSSAKIETSVVLAVSSNMPTVSSSKMNHENKQHYNGPEVFHPQNQFVNSYIPTTGHMTTGVNPHFVNIGPPNEVRVPNIPFNNLPYENHQPTPNGMDLALITNGIGGMMPASFQCVPLTTFLPGGVDQHTTPNHLYKPEQHIGPSTNNELVPHHPAKTSNNRPCITKIGNKVAKECLPLPTSDNVPAALKTQNFVFMSTGPGKVNRVVVHS